MKKLLALIALLPFAALAAPEERVVALGGDVTEIVYALGAQPSLVARDSTSQWPAAATALPDVGYLRQLNAEGILATRPTLVLASAQAQPSLVLKQIEQSNVRVVTILTRLMKKFGLSPRLLIGRPTAKRCAQRYVRNWRRSRHLNLINVCCLFSIMAG